MREVGCSELGDDLGGCEAGEEKSASCALCGLEEVSDTDDACARESRPARRFEVSGHNWVKEEGLVKDVFKGDGSGGETNFSG